MGPWMEGKLSHLLGGLLQSPGCPVVSLTGWQTNPISRTMTVSVLGPAQSPGHEKASALERS